MTQRSGCLLAPLLGLGGGSRKALPGPVVPEIPKDVSASERPLLARGRGATLAVLELLSTAHGDRVSAEVIGEVSQQVTALFDKAIALGVELSRARAFVAAHDPDALGRTQAELELQLLGAGLEETTALRQSLESLQERVRHSSQVRREIGVMEQQLRATVEALTTLGARVRRLTQDPSGVSAGTITVLDELREEHQRAEAVLDAFARTAREMEEIE